MVSSMEVYRPTFTELASLIGELILSEASGQGQCVKRIGQAYVDMCAVYSV